ncbi:hypothetical protein ACR6C2_34750 [Streptomyces sp. INA 01156]
MEQLMADFDRAMKTPNCSSASTPSANGRWGSTARTPSTARCSKHGRSFSRATSRRI